MTLLDLLRPRRAWVVALLLVVAETALLQASPLLVQRAIDTGIARGDRATVVRYATVLAVTIAVSYWAGRRRIRHCGALAQDTVADLRRRLHAHVQRLGASYYDGERSGRVLSRVTSDVDSLTELLQDGLVNAAVQALTLVLVVVALVVLEPVLALALLVSVAPAMVALTLWFRKIALARYLTVRDQLAGVLGELQDDLAGHETTQVHGQVGRRTAAHGAVVGGYTEAVVDSGRVGATYGAAVDSLSTLGQVVIVVTGAWLVSRERLTVGVVVAFVLYLGTFFQPIQQLVSLYDSYQSGRAAVTKIGAVLGTPPSVVSPPSPVPPAPTRGALALDGVTFGYVPGRPVLHDVTLEVVPGEVLALVGATGSGKSTVAKLLNRTYDPWSGAVRLDGLDLRALSLDDVRRTVRTVPQDPFLFATTVRANVALGGDGSIDDACALVGLPDPERAVNERGLGLSAGERQLVAMARAVVSRPAVLVLDEATSHLDAESERMVDAALDSVMAGRTVVVVAHRLTTARRADRIAVVDGGRVVDTGTHDELVRRGGTYAALYREWVRDAPRSGSRRPRPATP